MSDAKETNPKDAFASSRLPLDLVPDSLTAYAALAFLEGALKYGAYNWRTRGVRTSVYVAALRRHLAAFQNGEWADPQTNVPHLASVIACAGIILDAELCAKLEDDRPPAAPVARMQRAFKAEVERLKSLFPSKIST